MKEEIIMELPVIATIPICAKGSGNLEKTCGEVGCSNSRILWKRWEIFSGLWVYSRNMSSCHQEYRQLSTLMKSCAVWTDFVLEIMHKLIPLLSLQLPVVHDASVVASAWLFINQQSRLCENINSVFGEIVMTCGRLSNMQLWSSCLKDILCS